VTKITADSGRQLRHLTEALVETKKVFKSFRYKNRAIWQSPGRILVTADGHPELPSGAAPEFRGHPDVWSPEDLLVASVNSCLAATFQALAGARKLPFTAYESSAEGLLENVEGKYQVTQIDVRAGITLAPGATHAAAQEVLSKVKENCFISNSIKSKVTFTPEIKTA
jgi:organic hydroperoxide reductase OsmC/OhrA